MSEISVTIIDGYIDDPAALGVPPYISPMIRASAGAAMDAGASVRYITADMIRNTGKIPESDITVVLSGNTVPGKYIRSMPLSVRELKTVAEKIKGWKMLGGSAASSDAAGLFNISVETDLAAVLYDGLCGKEMNERLRTLDEWNRWMLLGAEIVKQHQDYPNPLVAEIETYRGCHRYRSGGCSYCIEPLKGKPLMRSPSDIIQEAKRLKELGIRNIRIGGQTCIISYGSESDSEIPEPSPSVLEELFTALKELEFDVLHVDNANPAVISKYPEQSEKVLRILKECCTPGNVLALGMESADPAVVKKNNLNATPSQVSDAVKLINRIGSERGGNGMPYLLPGINIISGLDGETSETNGRNMEFLESLLNDGMMLRRINIRQVMDVRREFSTKVDQNDFKKFKNAVRENIDRKMLERIVPYGTVLKNVYIELADGNVTFGRQIGSYPLLVGIPYPVGTEKFTDVMITEWGFRSVTGIEYPFRINKASMAAIASLPGIGKKRSISIARNRPFRDMDELSQVIGDDNVSEKLARIISFKESG
jgi:Uncharacterized Fe-S oxidoreductase